MPACLLKVRLQLSKLGAVFGGDFGCCALDFVAAVKVIAAK